LNNLLSKMESQVNKLVTIFNYFVTSHFDSPDYLNVVDKINLNDLLDINIDDLYIYDLYNEMMCLPIYLYRNHKDIYDKFMKKIKFPSNYRVYDPLADIIYHPRN